ncbi:MAG: hypothetical protein ACFC1C_02345 [Candidatus Malihini olakiniferum]
MSLDTTLEQKFLCTDLDLFNAAHHSVCDDAEPAAYDSQEVDTLSTHSLRLEANNREVLHQGQFVDTVNSYVGHSWWWESALI